MSQYLDKVRDVDPNDSDAVKDVLTAFFQNLSKYKNSHCDQWLNALENVINRFPKYCGQHRATIENHLIHYLESTSYYTVILSAKCAHSLQQVRPPQEKAASAKSCWRELMNALCEAAHALIDTLFAKTSNHNVQKKTSQSELPLLLALEDIDSVTNTQDVLNKTSILSVRLRNVLVFIQAMLVEIYPVAKPIRPQLILEVILRGLSASGNDNSDTISTVKVQALRTLDALVACLGSNIIPFSSLVYRIVMQTLRWSSDNTTKHSSIVRIQAYNTLTNNLTTHRTGQAHTWDAELTAHILMDVTPTRHVIQLTANAQPMKNLSKKARKKLANSMLMQSNISSHMPGEKNKINLNKESDDEIAIAALECAEAYLTTCGIFLKPTIHKQFQEVLVQQCYTIDNISTQRGMSLLRVLEASRKTCKVPPTQYCLAIYSYLVNSSHNEISKFCSQALLDIRLHLHCSPPSLNFAAEHQPKKRDDRKRMSDRNRAVLESLLGQERMPSEIAEEEEIITIQDEPSNKRPRTEDISDKISLSSDSQNSIEISDSGAENEIYFEDVQGVTERDGMQENNGLEREDVSQEGDKEITALDENSVTQKENSLTGKENSLTGKENSLPGKDSNELSIIEKETTENSATEISENELTQKTNEIVASINTKENKYDIFDAHTQLPLQVSNDTVDGEKSPVSMEVSYGYTVQKVATIEKLDDENLPSTNETDDIQITCGQQINSSQDDKILKSIEEPKENGIKSQEKLVNGNTEVLSKLQNGVEVAVEDMLADFVDEVNDETQTTQV